MFSACWIFEGRDAFNAREKSADENKITEAFFPGRGTLYFPNCQKWTKGELLHYATYAGVKRVSLPYTTIHGPENICFLSRSLC